MSTATQLLQSARQDVQRRVRLTDAWTEFRPHAMQQLLMWHPAPIKVCPAGRRSGKTAIGKRKAVLQLVRKRAWPAKVLIGAPTHDQARNIYWDDMKALVPPWWVAKYNETLLEIRTKWGAILRVMGLNKPARAEGFPWDWMLIDELADCVPGLLDRHLLPALSTIGRTVSCDLIGVPDEVGPNQAEYEKYWEMGLQWPRYPSVCSFHWKSADIIEPAKIAQFKASMDPIEFEQEFGGRFVSSGGKAIPGFDVSLHVREDYCDYEPRLPLDWTLDFGLGTNARALLCQSYKGHVWVLDEICCEDGSTPVQVIALRERAGERGYSLRRLRRFGDAAGNSGHSNTGESDYRIIDEMTRDLFVEAMELECNPLIKDTLNAVRGRVVTADNVVHLHVHPRCKKLIEEMKTAPWPSKLEEFHSLAALRYYCFRLFGEDAAGGFETASLKLSAAGTSGRAD